jgi:hypothetical protein
LIALKHADLFCQRRREPQGEAGAESYLLEEMRSARADRWAIYRHGCALAIPLCVFGEPRTRVVACVQHLWREEALPHLRIAYAMALERLGEPPRAGSVVP